MPTAAGKTFIALKAIELLKKQTLIIVPTLDLIDQWKKRVREYLDLEAGVVGGGAIAFSFYAPLFGVYALVAFL